MAHRWSERGQKGAREDERRQNRKYSSSERGCEEIWHQVCILLGRHGVKGKL